MLLPLILWMGFYATTRLHEVSWWIPRDLVVMSHSVLKAPPLAVSRDEIERKLRM